MKEATFNKKAQSFVLIQLARYPCLTAQTQTPTDAQIQSCHGCSIIEADSGHAQSR